MNNFINLVIICLAMNFGAPIASESPPSELKTIESNVDASGLFNGYDTDLDSKTSECPTVNAGPPAYIMTGPPGRDGLPGVDGNPGTHGIPGVHGSRGDKGECDCSQELKRITQSDEFFIPNIHQCAWDKLNFAMKAGPIRTCTFNKRRPFTSLRVEWHGTTRVQCDRGAPCCSRWFFTFNGGECTNPQTVEGLVYVDDHNSTINIHRPSSVVGICQGISSGPVDISFWVGLCDGGYGAGEVRTGWNSVSRIIIEEIQLT